MGIWDSYQYDIKDKLPEWWKHDAFLEPINRYSQKMIRDMVGGLLSNIGLVQPVQVWKTLPTEYSWVHNYTPYDERLLNASDAPAPLHLYANHPLKAIIPNSKRNCHGYIQLQLTGDNNGKEQHIDKLTIKNNNQTIVLNNITTLTDIKIFTEDGKILIDGVTNHKKITGSFNKIYSQAKNTNYDEVDIYDENKITYIEIESSRDTNFKLQIKLTHPVYYTEQNIRLHTVSAFPLEWVKLYGFFCHDFNNKQEWRFLWEKQYKLDDRIVFDRITKQFDCEIFYVQVKLHGIGLPLVYGFPQETLHSNAAFQTNSALDKWGQLFGLPRRHYRTNISEDEEPYTFPPFYKYDIEQDYWYEERLVNEYRYNEDAINAAYVKDTNGDNIAFLQSIDPFTRDIYVYTETIKHSIDHNKQTDEVYPYAVEEKEEGVTWDNPYATGIENYVASEVQLMPQSSETLNDFTYRSKTLITHFDIPELPKNIKIKGIELQLQGLTDIHSDVLKLDDRSQMLLKTEYEKADGTKFTQTDTVQINTDIHYWKKGQGVYKIGGPNDLFNLTKVTKEQLENGLTFNIGFTNTSNFLKASIVLYGIKLIVHYETIDVDYSIDTVFDRKEIVLSDSSKQNIQMKIKLTNDSDVPFIDQYIYIAVPPELNITKTTFPAFDLAPGETFTVGATQADEIIITPGTNHPTGKYDIIVFCNDKVIRNEITVKEGL